MRDQMKFDMDSFEKAINSDQHLKGTVVKLSAIKRAMNVVDPNDHEL